MPALRRRFVLASVALAMGVLLAEGAARVVDRAGCLVDYSGDFFAPHPLYGWTHIPGSSGWSRRCFGHRVQYETWTRINDRGLRDREFPYARGDAYRILALGDSFTEGMQVAMNETFAKQLEARLARCASIQRLVEVINAGTGAYGTDNELLFYQYEGRKYHPDLVLLVFYTGNDVAENSRPLISSLGFPYPDKPYFLREQGRLTLEHFPLPDAAPNVKLRSRIRHFLLWHSTLCRFLGSLVLPQVATPAHAEASSLPPSTFLSVQLKHYPPEWEEAWHITHSLIQRLRHEVTRDGARFAVVVFTSMFELSDATWKRALFFDRQTKWAGSYDRTKADRLIVQFLRRRRIPYVDLLAGFQEHLRVTGTTGYYDWDTHWTTAGHSLAADIIRRELPRLGLAPASWTSCE